MDEEKRQRLQKLGQQIKSSRLDHNMTQAKLAELIGVEVSHIWRIEKGKVEMKVLTYLNIRKALSLN